jgi:archaellum component FlaF (FlaF/FlaG flagellin family)
MTDNQFQNDFFNPDGAGDRKRSRFAKRYPAVRFMPHVRIPVEYVVVFGIVILVLLVVAYATGIERGKSGIKGISPTDIVVVEITSNLVESGENETRLEQLEGSFEESESQEDRVDITPEELGAADVDMSRKADVSDEKTVAKPKEPTYTIQLAAFAKKENVEKETARLKEAGNDAAYVKIGKWYQAYVQGYKTIGEARDAKGNFTEQYPDCYIRRQ